MLRVPGFGDNILSVKKVADKRQGCGVLFSGGARFYNREGNLVGWSLEPKEHSEMYPLICDIISGTHNNTALVTTRGSPVSEDRQRELLAMHARLAHVGAEAVCKLHPGLTRREMEVIQSCEACLQAKMVRRSYPDVPAGLKARRPGEIVSANIMIPTATSVGCAKNLLVMIDQFTSFLEIVPQRHVHPTTGEVSIPQCV